MILFHIINQLMSRDRHCTWSVMDMGWHRRQVLWQLHQSAVKKSVSRTVSQVHSSISTVTADRIESWFDLLLTDLLSFCIKVLLMLPALQSQSFRSKPSVSASNIAVNNCGLRGDNVFAKHDWASLNPELRKKYFNGTTCKQHPQCIVCMSRTLLTIVQNYSAEDASFTRVYCWRALTGALGRFRQAL